MNTYDVKCLICGAVNRSLFLEETTQLGSPPCRWSLFYSGSECQLGASQQDGAW